ncbi:MAG: hypothetical protein AAGA65_30530, partial [Actinomycetota bacterium]
MTGVGGDGSAWVVGIEEVNTAGRPTGHDQAVVQLGQCGHGSVRDQPLVGGDGDLRRSGIS